MEFNGAFELDDVSTDVAALVLLDPRAIERAVPGCEYIVPDDGTHDFDGYEHDSSAKTLPDADPETVRWRAFEEGKQYVALTRVGVRNINPTFESYVTIDECDAGSMRASGHGATSESEYTMSTNVSIEETADGSSVEWSIEVVISGRIAQFNDRVLASIANRVIAEFADNLEAQMRAAAG